jgi:hypothetical protein
MLLSSKTVIGRFLARFSAGQSLKLWIWNMPLQLCPVVLLFALEASYLALSLGAQHVPYLLLDTEV